MDLPSKENITIIATGPLTADELANKIQFLQEWVRHFFDAASPIIYGDTVDKETSLELVDTTKENLHIQLPNE